MTNFVVPAGNWTENVKLAISQSPNYIIGLEGDPAEGCDTKNFTAEYKCGISDVIKTIPTMNDAHGKSVAFNCDADRAKCNRLKLTLSDDGVLNLTDTNATNGQVLWTKAPPAAITGNAVALDNFKAVNGKKFGVETQGRNYLNSGEFLSVGEFIGSPTGTCRLEMVKSGTNNTLKVGYNVVGCTTTDPINSNSNKTYTIPLEGSNNVGKIGYVNSTGQLQVYPASMVSYTNAYEQTGNYTFLGGNIGTNTSVSDVSSCWTNCSENTSCAGVVFDSSNTMCQLKDGSIYSSTRYIDNNYQLYMRSKGVNDDVATSCSKDVYICSSDDWDSIISSYDGNIGTKGATGLNMTNDTKCGLANYTKDERTEVNTFSGTLRTIASSFTDKITNLLQKNHDLKTNIKANKDRLQSDIDEFIEGNQTNDWTGEQLQQLKAMTEDRDLNMMSYNYKHILWSILAILIIIGIIKYSKTIASNAVSAVAAVSKEIPSEIPSASV